MISRCWPCLNEPGDLMMAGSGSTPSALTLLLPQSAWTTMARCIHLLSKTTKIMLDLLQPPPAELAATYHQQVVKELGAAVEVRDAGPGRGKGIFATQDVPAGNVLFRERALVSQQDLSSRKELLTCSHCHRFVGSIEKQIAGVLKHVIEKAGNKASQVGSEGAAGSSSPAQQGAQGQFETEEEEEEEEDEDHEEWQYRMQLLEVFVGQQKVSQLGDGLIQLPMSDHMPLPKPVPCSYGSDEAYCSEACRDAAWSAYHCLLCCNRQQQGDSAAGASDSTPTAGQQPPNTVHGMAVDRQALSQFYEHASHTNDVFMLAARLVASVALKATAALHSNGGGGSSSSQAVQGSASGAASSSNACPGFDAGNMNDAAAVAALSAAWFPYSVGWKQVWWESVAAPDDMDADEFRAQLREIAVDSLSLLCASLPGVVAAWPPLFQSQVWGSIIGMFELNNLGLTVPSPVEDFFLLVDDLEEPEKSRIQEQTGPWLDALDKWYDTPFEGTGFYALHSCANHSCDPNAGTEGEADGRVAVYAMQDIKAGQEITLSYLDESEDEPMPYKQRQAALKDYGFKCQCSRCLADLRAKAARRPKGGGVKMGRR